MQQEFEIVIVGGGPAGLSAGIYIARQNVSCLIISKDLGGQMNLIPKLENYPGSIMSSGPILAKTLETQYFTFKGEMVYDTVEKITIREFIIAQNVMHRFIREKLRRLLVLVHIC